MGRKKKAREPDSPASENAPRMTTLKTSDLQSPLTTKSAPLETETPQLVISRNKHWRYISSFQGSWLQVSPDGLEALAHSNYLSPRPHPIDPAVLYDILKIRRAVDEAADLSMRAVNGLSMAAFNKSFHGDHSLTASAAALGFGAGANGAGMGNGGTKLSRERKHRMREMATQKLSQAYHLDEIAASVATMQAASTLDDVAKLVLQRSTTNRDAKYVHFFHEKIPSCTMTESTPLDPLDSIIAEEPMDGAAWRTRALTRIIKEEYAEAAKDLTEGLRIARYMASQHRAGKNELVLAKTAREQYGKDWKSEVKVEEEDQPSSLETQMLFHRAGVYLTIACRHVQTALDHQEEVETSQSPDDSGLASGSAVDDPTSPMSSTILEADRNRQTARKAVRFHAKRAIRDYMAFLSLFEYSPGLSPSVAQQLSSALNSAAAGSNGVDQAPRKVSNGASTNGATASRTASPESNTPATSTSLIKRARQQASSPSTDTPYNHGWPSIPPATVHQVSSLFSSNPPTDLPPHPRLSPTDADLSQLSPASILENSSIFETVTYHPLLIDALHSLLLCHALLQTPPKALLRHAHNVARLTSICDGCYVFMAPRSPARSDWTEVVRLTRNWIGLGDTWENLCRHQPLSASKTRQKNAKPAAKQNGTAALEGGRPYREPVLGALKDDMIANGYSFREAVEKRERLAQEDEETPSEGSHSAATTTPSSPREPGLAVAREKPKRRVQNGAKRTPDWTKRAEVISQWVQHAPLVAEGEGKAKKAAKRSDSRPQDGESLRNGGPIQNGDRLPNGGAAQNAHRLAQVDDLQNGDGLPNGSRFHNGEAETLVHRGRKLSAEDASREKTQNLAID